MLQKTNISVPHGSESGFTLIELLVVMAITSLLAAISLQGFALYKDKGYTGMAETMLHNAEVALNVGISGSDQLNGILWTIALTPGSVNLVDGETLVPGLMNPEDFYLYAYHDASCAEDWCLEDYIYVRPCKSDKSAFWIRFKNGWEWRQASVPVGWSC